MAVLPLIGAVIDLGTNTFNLAVGKKTATGFELLHTHSLPVGLGRGGIQRQLITAEAQERALDALQQLQQQALDFGASKMVAIGTSALRNASNAGTLIAAANQQLGLPLRIIDGLTEADYIWQGVRGSGALGDQPSLVVDIGGGSVEFLYATRSQVLWKSSLEIGIARLGELYPLTDPLLPETLAQSETWLRERLHTVIDLIRSERIERLCGSAGSFDVLMDLEGAARGFVPATANQLPIDRFMYWYERLLTSNRAQREALPGMKPNRKDMIVYALLLIRLLTDAIRPQHISCSTWSLREGALGELLGGG
jgi:exopolyphosphatase/guanosine-5'-triphosphate,3'-diphosphate pyrophosphatase